MYFYFLAALLVSSIALVAADECFTLNATFAVPPQICYPTYVISELYAQNNTGGDRLSSVFITLNNAANLPSLACADAFAEYYCAKFYPECDAGTTKPGCAATCSAVVTACANYTSLFTDPEFPLPSQTECDALATTDCSATPETNLTTFYTDCELYNVSKVVFMGNIVPTAVCQPYTVPEGNFTYTTGINIYSVLVDWIRAYGDEHTDDATPPNWMYDCIKAWSNFWCSTEYPECPENNVLPVLPVCRDKCEDVLLQCNETVTQYFKSNPWGYVVPTLSTCSGLPNNPGVNCFMPQGNSYTNLSFFFGSDPPSNQTLPTPTPTPIIRYTTTGVEYPPGGAATGGGIGAAVLVGILILIGILMLIMKKQDSR